MKYYFKSDYFKYIHPTNAPKPMNDYTKKELQEAIDNTSKIRYNKELFEDAMYESDDTIPKKQIGSIIIFPEVTEDRKEKIGEFIRNTFKATESELAKKYDIASDPTMFWEYGCDGLHFGASAVNCSTKDRFGINSPSIYIAGVSDSTMDYLVESAIDDMYRISANIDGKAKNESEKLNFKKFRSFLVYSIGSERFYEFATHERNVYHKPLRPKTGFDAKVYDFNFGV